MPIHKKLNPAIPTPLAKLIHRLIAVAPWDRPASARDVERRLERIERRLWLLRQPRWVKWAGVAALLFFAGWLLWAFGPLAWYQLKYGYDISRPYSAAEVRPEPSGDYPTGEPEEAWRQYVANLPAKEQAQAVAAKLSELNPEFDGSLREVRIEEGQVRAIRLACDAVSDIRPLQALPHLRSLHCSGTPLAIGQLADITPLSGLPLESLSLGENPALTDLKPLKGMKLQNLDLAGTGVTRLDDLDGSEIRFLDISKTQIRDLAPIKTMPNLSRLNCAYCPLDSLEPLADSNIFSLQITYRADRDRDVIRRMAGLRMINSMPIETFRRKYGVGEP